MCCTSASTSANLTDCRLTKKYSGVFSEYIQIQTNVCFLGSGRHIEEGVQLTAKDAPEEWKGGPVTVDL